MKVRTKLEAAFIVFLLVSVGSAWAVTRTLYDRKETISNGTYFYSGNYDFITGSHFNLTNKIYSSNGHIWNASGINLQLAIYDLNKTATNNGGGTVYLPKIYGGISISTTLKIPSNIILQGQGYGYNNYNGTILLLANGANCPLLEPQKEGAGGYSNGITLRDIWFNGNKAGQTDTTDVLLDFRYGRDLLIDHCYISSAKGEALKTNWATVQNCLFMDNNRTNIWMMSDTKFIHNEVYHGWLSGLSGTGDVYVADGYNIITDNFIQMCNKSYGICVYGISSGFNVIANNRISDIWYDGIFLGGGASNNTVTGNILDWCGMWGYSDFGGIRIRDGNNNSVVGNIIRDHSFGYLTYGIRLQDNCNNNVILGNAITGLTAHYIYNLSVNLTSLTGTNNIIRNNIGYKTENWGNTTVSNNGTITHSLATTPTVVFLTSNYANLSFMCMKKSSTTFTVIIRDINTHTTPLGSYYVMWYAKV